MAYITTQPCNMQKKSKLSSIKHKRATYKPCQSCQKNNLHPSLPHLYLQCKGRNKATIPFQDGLGFYAKHMLIYSEMLSVVILTFLEFVSRSETEINIVQSKHTRQSVSSWYII